MIPTLKHLDRDGRAQIRNAGKDAAGGAMKRVSCSLPGPVYRKLRMLSILTEKSHQDIILAAIEATLAAAAFAPDQKETRSPWS